jgi:hypothetical protein
MPASLQGSHGDSITIGQAMQTHKAQGQEHQF